MVSPEKLSTQQRRSINRVGKGVGIAFGLAVALAFFLAIAGSVRAHRDAVDDAAETAAAAIEQGIHQAVLKLETIDGLFSSSEAIDRDEFSTFVGKLDVHDEAEAVAVALRVSPQDLMQYREALTAAYPDIPLIPADRVGSLESDPGRDHYVVSYQSLDAGFPSVLGFDLASEPNRYEALVISRALESTVVSRFVRRASDLADDGFVVMTPVHDSTGEQIGVALAGISARSVVSRWVPTSILEQNDVIITGVGGATEPVSSWRRPSATALADLPGRSWIVAATPLDDGYDLVWMIFGAAAVSVGLAYGVGALITEIMSRRRLQRRLVLIQSLAQERQRTITALADFELLARNSSDIIARQKPDLTYLYVSPAVESLLGYTPEEMVGQQPWDSFHFDDHEAVRKSIASLAEGAERSDVEHRVRHADGHWLWFHTTSRAIRDSLGNLVELQTASRDVTERVTQRRALQEARDETERVANEKARFLATVSHEIRTPLNAVDGVSQLLAETDLDADQREYVGTIQSASASVVELVTDLLDLAKAEVGRLQIQAIDFDPRSCVGEVVRVLDAQASQKDVSLSVEFDEDVPEAITSDPYRLRQILVNLVGNALKFTDVGGVTVRVTCQARQTDSARLRFEVADTGIGIPNHRLDAVFEEFEQVDANTPARFGGTGLGLGISRRLVHLMGGIIGVESEVGVGSQFWFELPVGVGQAPEESARRCLVVGRPANRAPFAAMLRAVGWVVSEADRAPDQVEEPIFVRVSAVDALESDESVDGAVVVDLLPRRGNSQRVKSMGAVGYLGAPTSGTELDAVLTHAQSGEFTTRYVISAPSQSLRILAADDAASNRLLVERVLTRRGHHVVSVADGGAALAALDSGKFDVVLLDGHMPVLGGVEATREIRRRDRLAGTHTPVIVVSGRTSADEQAEAKDAGADLCVTKPFDVRRLQDVVERLGVRSGSEELDDQPVAQSDSSPLYASNPSELVDRSAFAIQVGDIAEFAGEIVESVSEEWTELAAALEPGAVDADPETAITAAHRLKGVLGLVGATSARELAARIESAGRNGDTATAKAAADRLVAVMDQTKVELAAILAEMEPAVS